MDEDDVIVAEVDIATRTIGGEEDIYVVRPGAAYSLYDEFLATDRIFLDFPGLGLSLTQEPSTIQLREMIARSLKVKGWHDGGRKTADPSRRPEDYEGQARGRKFGRYQAAITKLYFGMPAGTIIVVPGAGLASDVLIGVLVGAPVIAHDIDAYPGEAMPVRRVKWLGRKQRAAFSSGLRERLGNSHPVMALDRGMREEILEAGFDRFIFNGQFHVRLETTKAEFNTLDDYDIQSFINYVAGVLAAKEEGAKAPGSVDMHAAIKALRDHPDLIPELTANINSPGFLRLISDRVSPLVIAVLFSVAIAVPLDAASTIIPTVVVSNSGAGQGSDPCAVIVSEEAKGAMTLMKYDEWKEACEHARDANVATGVKTNMKVKVTHGKPSSTAK